jgi:hypothetical protein
MIAGHLFPCSLSIVNSPVCCNVIGPEEKEREKELIEVHRNIGVEIETSRLVGGSPRPK